MNGDAASARNQPIAALAYLGFFVTGVIFLFVEPYNQDDFVRFHARQSIAFTIAWFAAYIVFSVFITVMPHPIAALLGFVAGLTYIGFAVMWVVLMYKAYNGERYRIPELADIVDNVAGNTP
jgi:uncharacterized membrane protein